MAISIKSPNIDWKNWMDTYSKTIDSNKEGYQSDWNKMLQGIGLTLTGLKRSELDEQWNNYIKNNPDASIEDMYKIHSMIYGGF